MRVRPIEEGVFGISSLSAEMMKVLDSMIGHSILLDFLSPACYKYDMIGNYDHALFLCKPNDASESVQSILKRNIAACKD